MAWTKGQSGNPGGRPKAEVCLSALLRQALAARDPKAKRTKAELFVTALLAEALDGNVRAMELVFDRVDGPLVKKLEASVDLEAAIREAEAILDDAASPGEGPGGLP
jgi:hypothetical protein